MRNRRDSRRGSAMIELALSMIVLVPILYGTLQYGFGFFMFQGLANAVRSGARYASMRPMEGTNLEAFKEAVRNRTAEGNPGGLTAKQVAVEVAFERDVPVKVTVSILAAPSRLADAVIPPGQPAASFPYLGAWMPSESRRRQ